MNNDGMQQLTCENNGLLLSLHAHSFVIVDRRSPPADPDSIWIRAGFDDENDFLDWFRKIYTHHPTKNMPGLAETLLREAICKKEFDRHQFEDAYALYR